jgi:uncharacterized membrane protein YfcA
VLLFAVATLLAAIAACVQGTIGFGLALTSAPLLALLDPAFVPGPLLVASLPLALASLARERRQADVRGVVTAFAGRVPGTAVGALAVAALPLVFLHVSIALLVLLGVVVSLRAPRFYPTRRVLLVAGGISGVTGTIAAIGGPPIALVYQHATGPRLRATMALYFALGTVLSVAALWLTGSFGSHEVGLSAILVPGTAVGFLASGPVLRVVDAGRLRPVVLGAAALSAVVLLVTALL